MNRLAIDRCEPVFLLADLFERFCKVIVDDRHSCASIDRRNCWLRSNMDLDSKRTFGSWILICADASEHRLGSAFARCW
jgi:hypothetical protein